MYPLGWSNAPYVENEVPVTVFRTGLKNVGEGGAVSPPPPSSSYGEKALRNLMGECMGDGGLKTFLKSSKNPWKIPVKEFIC